MFIKKLIQLIKIHLHIKKSTREEDLPLFTQAKLSLIKESILFNILSEIINIQVNKPLYFPILTIMLLLKILSH